MSHIVIYFIVCFIVSVICGSDEQCENNKENGEHFCDLLRKLIHVRYNRTMLCLLKRLVKDKNQCRKHGNTTEYAKNYAFSHNDTEVKTKREAHEAKSGKAGNCRN